MAEGDRFVLRFSPFSADGLSRTMSRQADLDLTAGRTPRRWGVSAYTGTPSAGESVDEMVVRVCLDVPVGGRTVAVVGEAKLYDHGFVIHRDEPPLGHVLLGNATLTPIDDVGALAAVLSAARRRNPAWKKGL